MQTSFCAVPPNSPPKAVNSDINVARTILKINCTDIFLRSFFPLVVPLLYTIPPFDFNSRFIARPSFFGFSQRIAG